ncbi:hypothetical protein OOU_Y34scaffold00207g19 [Pyricularia oryzae Y34]|uniref:Uncharacterized protein n=1 Tax=Pyricularia oryzae (strain Y34) TaxID=1143189 RepID=A0AA97PPS8_PYRO3|nr:hypothetical protein OOU_Y34scaffold00207g19 [Pyricularia oryzae Y34]
MEAISAYSLATCAWLGAQAFPMLLTPGFVNSMLVEGYEPASCLAQLALSLLSLALSGVLPLAPAASADDSISPYADAAVLLTALYHAANAFHSWARWGATGGSAAYGLGFVGSGVLAAFGLWCLMFAGDKGRISKRTGADKRTSGFPFRNVEADKRKVGQPSWLSRYLTSIVKAGAIMFLSSASKAVEVIHMGTNHKKLTRQPVGYLATKTPLGFYFVARPGVEPRSLRWKGVRGRVPYELPTAPRGQGTDPSTPVAR